MQRCQWKGPRTVNDDEQILHVLHVAMETTLYFLPPYTSWHISLRLESSATRLVWISAERCETAGGRRVIYSLDALQVEQKVLCVQ